MCVVVDDAEKEKDSGVGRDMEAIGHLSSRIVGAGVRHGRGSPHLLSDQSLSRRVMATRLPVLVRCGAHGL